MNIKEEGPTLAGAGLKENLFDDDKKTLPEPQPNDKSLTEKFLARVGQRSEMLQTLAKNTPEESQAPERRPLKVDLNEFSGTKYLAEYPPSYDWLLKNSLRMGCLGVIVGPPGAGKGTLAIQLCAAVASGTPLLGTWEVGRQGKVLYLSREDDKDVIHRRAHYALKQLPILEESRRAEAAANFFGVAVHGEVSICREEFKAATVKTDNFTDLKSLIEEARPVLVVLDTLIRFAGVEENSNPAITAFCAALEELAVEYGCTIILLHHSNKASGDCIDGDGELAHSLTQSAIRGASALAGCVRWAFVMTPISAALAERLILEAEQDEPPKADGSYAACRVAKKNVGPQEARHYLGRGEHGLLFKASPSVRDAEADAHRLAEEIKRREEHEEKPLPKSRCGKIAFGWGIPRTKKAVEKGIDLGFFEEHSKGKFVYLETTVPSVPKEPEQFFSLENQ